MTSSLEGKLVLLGRFSIEEKHDGRTEPDLVNRGGVRVLRTRNHEWFEREHAIYLQGHSAAKKPFLRPLPASSFRRVVSTFIQKINHDYTLIIQKN